ncbi:MAG TPA: hypothetical protein VMU69_20885 [Bradyrhizobium sp.]|nr:hypothetical protein [Bradyrhizobium sp.]
MRDYNRESINAGQAKPVGDFVTVAATIGVIAAGVALFEVALIPGHGDWCRSCAGTQVRA